MAKEQSMVRKTLIYFAGNFSSKIFSVLIIPIYANFLTASELGNYDYQQTLGNLLAPIIALAIWEGILRFGLKATNSELKTVLSTSYIVSGITILISFFILLVTYTLLYGISPNTFMYVLVIVNMPIIQILGYSVRAQHKSMIYALSGVISSVVNMIGILILVVWQRTGLFGLLLSTIIANYFNAAFLIVKGRLFDSFKLSYFSWSEAKKLLSFSIPLIANLVFGWLISGFSRLYITQSMGATANGIYAFASKFSAILLQLTSIVNMSVIEDAVQTIGQGDWITRFEKNIENVTKIFFLISFILLPVVGLYYQTVHNSDFQSSLHLTPILILYALCTALATLFGNVFSVYNETSKVFITTIIGGGGTVIFAIIFGHFFGITGICIAQLLGAVLLVAARYLYGQRIQKYYFNLKLVIMFILFFVIISVGTISRNILVQSILFIGTTMYGIYSYKDFILRILRNIKEKL